MGFPKVEFITVEDAVKVAIDRLELVEPQYKLWLWDEFAQLSFVTDNQFDIGYEQAKEDAIELLEKELHRKADRKTEQTEPQRWCDADCNEDCNDCARESELCKTEQTEPQTDCGWR